MYHPLRRNRARQQVPAPRRGFVLVAVLLVVVVLALAAYQFSSSMTAEYGAANSASRFSQVKLIARSAIDYSMVMLSDPNNFSSTLGSNPYDNMTSFQHIVVQQNDNPHMNGAFDIIAPPDYDSIQQGVTAYHYGVTDEGGKININALFALDSSGQILTNFLMTLPNMTEDIANSIVDWIDPDDDTRENGAESDYYSGLTPSYQAKNAPLDSIEELLLVKGVTPQLLFGNDQNRNGVLDPGEDDGTGAINPGWASLITVFSRERNLSSQNVPRINVNSSDLNTLIDQLSTAVGEEMADYIIGYRLYGSSSGGSSTSGSSNSGSGAGGGGGGGGGGMTAPTTPNSPSPTNNPKGPTTTPSPSPNNPGRPNVTGPQVTGPASVNQAQLSVPQNAMTMPQPSMTRGATTGRATVTFSAGGAGGGGGGSSSGGGGTVQGTLSRGILGDLTQPTTQPSSISSLYALINTSFTIPGQNGQPSTVYTCPLNNQATLQSTLPTMLDQLTTQSTSEIPARLNINTASQLVLAALPGLSSADVETIVSQRPQYIGGGAADPTFQSTAWLLTQANLSPTTLAAIDRYISASSQVYRVVGFGYFDGGGPTGRVEAVIDTNGGHPRLMYYRDWSELGKSYTPQSTTNQ